MIESGFTADVHSRLRGSLSESATPCIVWKINDDFAGGVFDAYYSGPKGCLWIEYKFYQKLPSRKFKIPVSDNQRNWILTQEAHEHTPVYVVLGSPSAVHIVPNLREALLDKHKIDVTISRREYVQWLRDQII